MCRSGQGCRRAWRDATTGAMVQTVLYSSSFCSCSSWAWMLTCPSLCNDRCPVFCGQSAVQFLNLVVVVPVVQRPGFGPDSVSTVWRSRSCSSSICLLCLSLCNDRCRVSCGQSTSAVLGCVHARPDAVTRGDSTGAVVHARRGSDTRGDSTGAVFWTCCLCPLLCGHSWRFPQVQFLVLSFVPVVTPTPVEIPQVQFSDKDSDVPVFMHDRCLWWSRECVSDKDADVPSLCTTGAQIQLDRLQQFQLVF